MTEFSSQPEFDDELLSAYLDDELSAEERVRVEAHLAADPAGRRMLEELRAASQALHSLPQEAIGHDLRELILQRAEQAMLTSTGAASSARAVGSNKAGPRPDDLPLFTIGRTRRAWVWAAMALAAGLLIMVIRPGVEQNENPPAVAVRSPATDQQAKEAAVKTLVDRERYAPATAEQTVASGTIAPSGAVAEKPADAFSELSDRLASAPPADKSPSLEGLTGATNAPASSGGSVNFGVNASGSATTAAAPASPPPQAATPLDSYADADRKDISTGRKDAADSAPARQAVERYGGADTNRARLGVDSSGALREQIAAANGSEGKSDVGGLSSDRPVALSTESSALSEIGAANADGSRVPGSGARRGGGRPANMPAGGAATTPAAVMPTEPRDSLKQATNDYVLVHLRVKQKVLDDGAFDQLLASKGIRLDEQQAQDQQEHLALSSDDSKSGQKDAGDRAAFESRATNDWFAKAKVDQPRDLVFVEAAPATIEGLLADLQKDDVNFASVVVDDMRNLRRTNDSELDTVAQSATTRAEPAPSEVKREVSSNLRRFNRSNEPLAQDGRQKSLGLDYYSHFDAPAQPGGEPGGFGGGGGGYRGALGGESGIGSANELTKLQSDGNKKGSGGTNVLSDELGAARAWRIRGWRLDEDERQSRMVDSRRIEERAQEAAVSDGTASPATSSPAVSGQSTASAPAGAAGTALGDGALGIATGRSATSNRSVLEQRDGKLTVAHDDAAAATRGKLRVLFVLEPAEAARSTTAPSQAAPSPADENRPK